MPYLLVVLIVIAALGGSSPAAEDGRGALALGWGKEDLGPFAPLDLIDLLDPLAPPDLVEGQGGALERKAPHSSRASGPPGPAQAAGSAGQEAAGGQVKYIFDWGDGTVSETEFVDPGTVVTLSHIWDSPGVYSVRVRAEDVYGASSQWSSSIDVTIAERVNRFVGLRRLPVS